MAMHPLISALKSPEFMFKEYLHRRPDPRYQPRFVEDDCSKSVEEHTSVMRRDGIVILPDYFSADRLAPAQSAFEESVAGRSGINKDAYYNDDIFVEHPQFLDFALDNYLMQIVGRYYQKPFGLGRASAMRLFPTPPHRAGSFQWHHDARGRQVHMMVLLSDVTEQGQRMTYLKGSHDRYYSHHRGIVRTQFNKDVESDSTAPERIENLVGGAGTVALFDANGLHSGNRNDVEKRDALTFCYVTWRHFKPITVGKETFESLPAERQQVLTFNPRFSVAD